MIGQWTRFSLRLLFVVAMVVAAHASGKATMERRAWVAEADAMKARERASDFEAQLRRNRTQLAMRQTSLKASAWSADRDVVMNDRWIIDSSGGDERQCAAALDSLGIKLVGVEDNGKKFRLVSNFLTGPTIETCDKLPADCLVIKATDMDYLLLVNSGVTLPRSGIVRQLPPELAGRLARAEAGFTAHAGITVNDLEKTWFSVVARRANANMIAVVTGHRLVPSKGRLLSHPYRVSPKGSRPRNSMRQTSSRFKEEVLSE